MTRVGFVAALLFIHATLVLLPPAHSLIAMPSLPRALLLGSLKLRAPVTPKLASDEVVAAVTAWQQL